MFRKIGFGAAAALTVGMLAVGCSEDGDTIISGGGLLATDNFPGSQVAENNVADDGKAFSNQGQDLLHQMSGTRPVEAQVYWNVSNGEAIGVYTAQANSPTGGSTQKLLYFAYFNGTSWSAPVAVRGRDSNVEDDQTADIGDVIVTFINTQGTTDQNASQRNGDAVIVFTRRDLNDDPTTLNGTLTDEDPNVRAWFTYFDRSAASSAASGTVVRGFNTEALAIDTDNVFTGSATPDNDPSVESIGVVTNGLMGTHQFGPRATDKFTAVDSGQPTDFMSIIYAKEGGSGATAIGTRLFEVTIDGTVAGNVLTDLVSNAVAMVPGTGSLATGDDVSNTFVVHNDLMFWIAGVAPQGDTIATVTRFDETGSTDEAVYSETVNSTNLGADSVGLPAPESVFGPDHGLASTYFLFEQNGFSTDNTGPNDGEAALDSDLMVGKIDDDATLAVETAKIDNFDDTVFVSANPTRGARSIDDVSVRMNRTAEYITVLYSQSSTDVDTDAAGDVPNSNVNLYATVIQTRKPVSQGVTPARDLADSIYDDNGTLANFQGIRVPAQLASGVNAGSGTRNDVSNVEFQLDLIVGLAESQQGGDEGSDNVHLDPACGIQSDAYRMNFVYTQVDDPNTANSDINRLLVNGVIVTLGATAADAPDVDLVSTTEEVVDTQDVDYVGNDFVGAFAVDAGDQSRDTAGLPTGDSGRVLVFYSLDSANTPDDDSVTGSFVERRAFVWDAGNVELLSTDGISDHDQFDEFRGVVTVAGSGTGTHFAGTTIHVIWTEFIDRTQGRRLVTRSYDKGAINDSPTANDSLENRFTPNLVGGTAAANPVAIDNPTNGSLLTAPLSNIGESFVAARSGTTVGVYFIEDEHLYYSDTSSDANGWDSASGQAAPQLVDNDSPNGQRILSADIYVRPACDTLPKSMAFFLRDDPSQTFGNNFPFNGLAAVRSYVRIHN